jgi:hypothetical protein
MKILIKEAQIECTRKIPGKKAHYTLSYVNDKAWPWRVCARDKR